MSKDKTYLLNIDLLLITVAIHGKTDLNKKEFAGEQQEGVGPYDIEYASLEYYFESFFAVSSRRVGWTL